MPVRRVLLSSLVERWRFGRIELMDTFMYACMTLSYLAFPYFTLFHKVLLL